MRTRSEIAFPLRQHVGRKAITVPVPVRSRCCGRCVRGQLLLVHKLQLAELMVPFAADSGDVLIRPRAFTLCRNLTRLQVPIGRRQNPSVSPHMLLKAPLALTRHGRQLQQGKGAGEEGYNGMVDCFRKIVKNEGFSRLYRGITAPILMEAPKRYVFAAQTAPRNS